MSAAMNNFGIHMICPEPLSSPMCELVRASVFLSCDFTNEKKIKSNATITSTTTRSPSHGGGGDVPAGQRVQVPRQLPKHRCSSRGDVQRDRNRCDGHLRRTAHRERAHPRSVLPLQRLDESRGLVHDGEERILPPGHAAANTNSAADTAHPRSDGMDVQRQQQAEDVEASRPH